jgi:hypothetical protein
MKERTRSDKAVFRSQNIPGVFYVKIKSAEGPDDIEKVYFATFFNRFFDPYLYVPTGVLKIDFGHPCRGVQIWTEKSNEKCCEINLCNIIRTLY